ncbi:MAG: hypothetical protein SFV22_19125 [Saprospiraceae bacterium]|nr:hypothetical protein [Saprospiraceae bacterium]
MKNAAFFSLLLLSVAMIGLASCNPDSNSNNGSTPPPGAWKVSYFFDKQDETGNYASYVFEFGSNGSMSATNGAQTWSGTWATGFDDSKDKFLIDFSGAVPSALAELEEDWLIIQINDDSMHFEHTSGGNGDTDVLKFVHN